MGEGRGLAITAIRRETGPARPRIVVDVAAADATDVELYAEGPTADWALPVPEPLASPAPGLHRFAFDLDGIPPGVKPEGARLKLTAVSKDNAIEVDVHLE
jgi:hypothetical protein